MTVSELREKIEFNIESDAADINSAMISSLGAFPTTSTMSLIRWCPDRVLKEFGKLLPTFSKCAIWVGFSREVIERIFLASRLLVKVVARPSNELTTPPDRLTCRHPARAGMKSTGATSM